LFVYPFRSFGTIVFHISVFFVKYLQISEIIPYFAKVMVIKFMPTI
jgi:hypothetical protein